MNKIFFYGTLKSGFSAHYLLEHDAKFVAKATTSSQYSLYDVGSFPGMVKEESQSGVKGELFEVNKKCLERLDRYEGIEHGLFRRDEIELDDGNKVLAYLFNRSFQDAEKIESGEWTSDQE